LSFCIHQWPLHFFTEDPKLTVAMLIRTQIPNCIVRNSISLHLYYYYYYLLQLGFHPVAIGFSPSELHIQRLKTISIKFAP
jgi:hypothetical protein